MGAVPSAAPVARDPRRAVRLLGLLALGAVGIGFAAVLLLPAHGASSAPGGPGTFSSTSVNFEIAGEIIGILIAGLVALLLYMRFTGPGGAAPKRFFVLILVYFLVAITFLSLVHIASPGGFGSPAGPAAQNNSTVPIVNGTSNLSSGNNTTGPFVEAPAAFWYAVLGAVVITIVGMLVVAMYLGRQAALSPGTEEETRADVEEAFQRALRALEEPGDPRAVLIALYAQLLHRIGGRLPELDAATPREIERACVKDLGIPAGPAAELRALFERARYSTLPLGPADVDRAREALRQAVDSLRPPRTR